MRGRLGSWSLAGLAGLLLLAYGLFVRHGPALADEFIYLAGARHLAGAGSLHARYYDARALVERGYPHHDVHAPGYVILLGAVAALLGDGYWTAVTLNVIAYLAGALLTRGISRSLGCDEVGAWWSGALYLLLPIYLPYVFWVMAEVTLGSLLLLSLFLALRYGHRAWGAVGAGLVFGVGLLVRESMLFALPALVVILWKRRRLTPGLAVTAAFLFLVYLPLSRDRAPGGANFWVPSSGRAFGFEAVQAAEQGRLGRTARLVVDRVRWNVGELRDAGWTEKGVLTLLFAIPFVALLRARQLPELDRHVVGALGAGWAVVVALLFTVYVVGQWSGLRYVLFLIPTFLPWVTSSPASPRPAFFARWAPLPILLIGAFLNLTTLRLFNDYKTSRQKRQTGIASYVEKYLPVAPARIVLPNGWLYGLRHYPVEVVSSLPASSAELRLLEREVFFDYLVLPGDSPLGQELDARKRYRRVNADQPDPPLRIYARLR